MFNKFTLYVLFFVLGVAGITAMMHHFMGMPIVQMYNDTGECAGVVELVEPKVGYTCNNLPPKYEVMWVSGSRRLVM